MLTGTIKEIKCFSTKEEPSKVVTYIIELENGQGLSINGAEGDYALYDTVELTISKVVI